MTYYDEQLKTLQEKIARFRQLASMIKELRLQCDSLSEQVRRLKEIKLDEQEDVARLEGRSLASFFYNVIGRMDEKLDKERQEAYAARVKYDAAARELEAAESDLLRYEKEYSELMGCQMQYENLLNEKAAAVKAAGGADAAEILRLEERCAFLESQEKELREAIFAGSEALETTRQILDSLGSAHGWGTWDMLGGGLFADMAKHSHLNEAQCSIEHLQSQLRRFKTELADVTIHADIQVNVEGFLRFADYFFDGLFADWAVMDKINQSQAQVENTRGQIVSVISRLNSLMSAAQHEQTKIRETLDSLILRAQL